MVTLIEKYETEHYPIALPDPVNAIREAMEIKGLKDNDQIPAFGSKTVVSFLLNRKRALTVNMITNLSELLGLPVEVLVQPYDLHGKKEPVS